MARLRCRSFWDTDALDQQPLVRFDGSAEPMAAELVAGTVSETDKSVSKRDRRQAVCKGDVVRTTEGHRRHLESTPAETTPDHFSGNQSMDRRGHIATASAPPPY